MSEHRPAIALRDWLADRTPAPPRALADRLASIVGDESCGTTGEIPMRLVLHAEQLIRNLGHDRSAAGDLLAADALVTYALEAAADECADLPAVAQHAMRALAACDRDEGPTGE